MSLYPLAETPEEALQKDRPAARTYVKTTALEPVPVEMARADVAHFLVEAAEKDTWNGHAVQIGG